MLQPSLLSATFTLTPSEVSGVVGTREISVHRLGNDPTASHDLKIALPSKRDMGPIKYEVTKIDDVTKEDITETRPDSEIVGVWIRHFFPLNVAVSFDQAKQKALAIADAICGRRPVHRLSQELQTTALPDGVVALIARVITEDNYKLPLPEGAQDRHWTVGDAVNNIKHARIGRRPNSIPNPTHLG